MKNKILGALIGAAAGDAMASATDGRSYGEILEVYGAEVRDFIKPVAGSQASGREAGQFTDAFSIPLFLVNEIINEEGRMNTAIGKAALKKWGQTEYFTRFAGMTTKKVVNELNAAETNDLWAFSGHLGSKLFKGHYYALSSNGAACKAFVPGLFNPGNRSGAIRDCVELTMASHDDPLSISGACAVSAAVAACFEKDSTIFSVVSAAVDGSVEGEKAGRARDDVWDYPGPSTTRRLGLAQQVALKNAGSDKAASELRDIIGCGPEVAETVPLSFGLLIARKNKPLEAIYDAVNIGDETCAAAVVTGALTGALYGPEVFPESWKETVERQNEVDLTSLANGITKYAAESGTKI